MKTQTFSWRRQRQTLSRLPPLRWLCQPVLSRLRYHDDRDVDGTWILYKIDDSEKQTSLSHLVGGKGDHATSNVCNGRHCAFIHGLPSHSDGITESIAAGRDPSGAADFTHG